MTNGYHVAGSSQNRGGYTLREGLTRLAAQDLGLDPDLAAAVGDDARAALNLVRRARDAADPAARVELLEAAANELRNVAPGAHSRFLAQLDRVMGDIAGTGQASINPVTGAQEFALWDKLERFAGASPPVQAAFNASQFAQAGNRNYETGSQVGGIPEIPIKAQPRSNRLPRVWPEPGQAPIGFNRRGLPLPTKEEVSSRAYPDTQQPLYYSTPQQKSRETDTGGGGDTWDVRFRERDKSYAFHLANDQLSSVGDEIVAPISGRVIRIEKDGKYNGVWVLADDGRVLTRQLYSDPSVSVGDRVRGGETVIGKQKDIEPFYGPKVPTHMHLDVFDPTRDENGEPRSGPVKTFGTRDYYRLDAKPALQRAPKYR